MKPHPHKSGVRENTASPRQHASRFGDGPKSCDLSEVSEELLEEDTLPTPKTPTANGCDFRQTKVRQQTTVKGENLSEQASTAMRIRRGRSAAIIAKTEECLVDVNAAARHLAVSASTLYGWVWQRKISFVKVGRAVRFDLADLKEFVRENRVQARRPSKA
jgi:excisionase family DNA binding protein